jgi:hypothetical protein
MSRPDGVSSRLVRFPLELIIHPDVSKGSSSSGSGSIRSQILGLSVITGAGYVFGFGIEMATAECVGGLQIVSLWALGRRSVGCR